MLLPPGKAFGVVPRLKTRKSCSITGRDAAIPPLPVYLPLQRFVFISVQQGEAQAEQTHEL